MKRKTTAPLAPVPRECPQCTTPTRCGRTADGRRGPRCVGKADAPDDCDCLNRCGDDPWLAKGKARPCAVMVASQRMEQARLQAKRELAADLIAAAEYLAGDGVVMQAAQLDRIAGVLRLLARQATAPEAP